VSIKIKPGISRATRMVMVSRKPIGMLIEAQKARIEEITGRIGRLMSRRVDEEEILAELLAMEQGRQP